MYCVTKTQVTITPVHYNKSGLKKNVKQKCGYVLHVSHLPKIVLET